MHDTGWLTLAGKRAQHFDFTHCAILTLYLCTRTKATPSVISALRLHPELHTFAVGYARSTLHRILLCQVQYGTVKDKELQDVAVPA